MPKTKRENSDAGPAAKKAKHSLEYQYGFGNLFVSEALPDAVPKGKNNPQKCRYGLYAEQLNGTAFTVPRDVNQRTWFYRIRPSVKHEPFEPQPHKYVGVGYVEATPPNQLRWKPFELPKDSEKVDFVAGLRQIAGSGDPSARAGMQVHVYSCNTDMVDTAMCNGDGDFLFVPQQGTLVITTEFGKMEVPPNHIAVVQRGMKFSVAVPDGASRGYIAEIFEGHFVIPDLGPIGANGLANPADFKTPVAAYEDRECTYTIVQKFLNNFYQCKQGHSPFDVVGWKGNYAPYCYDLENFCTINSVSFDHIDPSIFTVLTCQTAQTGVACCDFVIFPPRWSVHEDTFRPPYYHRNCMSEFMGLIKGKYEAKEEGFAPGGATLHSCMTPHGPDAECFEKASNAELKAEKIAGGTMAFMFESHYIFQCTEYALVTSNKVDAKYNECWAPLQKHFTGKP